MSDSFFLHENFGPERGSPVKKMGDRAEASRPKGDDMQTLAQASASAKVDPFKDTQEARRERARAWIAQQVRNAENEPVSFPIELTPDLASALLERNPDNRNITGTKLQEIARDINGGRWQFNGEPLIVSIDGLLNDGQHRCQAVVETGRSIRTMISFGFDRESRMTLDQGSVRTTGNYLSMSGVPDGNNVAAVTVLIWQYKELGRISSSGAERPTKSQSLLVATSYLDIADSLSVCSKTNGVASKSILAFCHWAIARKAGRQLADAFATKLIEGADLGTRDPILYARNKLMSARLTSNEKVSLVFRAWNAWRAGEKPVRLQFGQGKLPKLEG